MLRDHFIAKETNILEVLALAVAKVEASEVVMADRGLKDKLMQLLEYRLVEKILLWMI